VIVLDTHVWYWWVSDSVKLSQKARRAIERESARGVSPVSFFEMARLVERGKVRIDRPIQQWLDLALAQPGMHALELTAAIAARAAALLDPFPGDPMDRIIAATAIVHACPLVTVDSRIAGHAGITTIW
jgi:PIN domain nuclease of toxin-antitoxin system